jgi:hypothetical protein
MNVSGKFRTSAIWLGLGVNLLNIAFALLGLYLFILNRRAIKTLDFGLDSLKLFLSLSISIVGALIIAKRPDHLMGWIYSAIGFFVSLSEFSSGYTTYALITRPGILPGGEITSVLSGLVWAPGLSILLTYAILLYPTGKLPTPRWRIVAWASLVPPLWILVLIVLIMPYGERAFLEGAAVLPGWLNLSANLTFLWIIVCGMASLVSIIVRYLYSRAVERQQIKWFAFATILFFAVYAPQILIPSSQVSGWLKQFLTPFAALVPAATAIAILRYRLWDIDVIIRKTVIYSLLTASLALVYFGSVLLLQDLFEALTGQSRSPVVIVISTLAIAALFSPLQRRIQNGIDRRFYRRKYDAEQTLEAFAAGLRQEVDLDEISQSMLRVVQEAMQPERASFWLIRSSGTHSHRLADRQEAGW